MNLCLKCFQRLRTCLCPHLQPFDTNGRFLIFMHPKEYKKERTGTGRLTQLTLKNSKILVGLHGDQETTLQDEISRPDYQTLLLYPGQEALNISTVEKNPFIDPRPKQIVVIDGTWPCAKKMMKLTPSLHSLPRISFSPSLTSEFIIKHQPLPGCLSTIESVAQVLKNFVRLGLEKENLPIHHLQDLFLQMVKNQVDCVNDPNLQGYRKKPLCPPEERKISKKWEKRPLFFQSGE